MFILLNHSAYVVYNEPLVILQVTEVSVIITIN